MIGCTQYAVYSRPHMYCLNVFHSSFCLHFPDVDENCCDIYRTIQNPAQQFLFLFTVGALQSNSEELLFLPLKGQFCFFLRLFS